MMRFGVLLTAAGAIAAPAQAQVSTAPAAVPAAADDDGNHGLSGPEIVVTGALPQNRTDVLASTVVLTGADLAREVRPTLGETLARQPGVSATSFGPNASRPILRGLQGDRVKVLTDGIGSFDASTTSVDHAVVINPLTANRIEVLRGPSALLYGPEAIGGVVNVLDSRIPRAVPAGFAHVDALASYGSAADERSGSAAVSVAVGGGFVVHADGSYAKTDDLEIGGYVLSDPLRAEARASSDPGIRALADFKGTLPNSAARTWDVAGGAAFITDTGNLGFSVSHYDSRYGVPIRYSLDPSIEAEQSTLAVRQTRADGRGEVETGGDLLQSIKVRAGFANYRHDELEEDGAIGTSFYNQSLEGRVDLVQAKHGVWSGTVGGQLMIRNFDVAGDEKFVPKNQTVQRSVFAFQTLDWGRLKAEASARYERTDLDADADPIIGNAARSRAFDAISAAIGASYGLGGQWRVGVNLSRTERTPTAEELFADGPHGGTQAFEIGNPDFSTERGWGAEAVLRGSGHGYSFEASAFYNRYSSFIYEYETGAVEDELPVFQSAESGARYWGLDVQGSLDLARFGGWTIAADATADYVHATILDFGPAPRIPPLRILGGIEARNERLTGRVEAEWVDDQHRTAPIETGTDCYTLVNASIAWKPLPEQHELTLILQADNLLDVDARRHASFLKDYAPLAGRDIRLTARLAI